MSTNAIITTEILSRLKARLEAENLKFKKEFKMDKKPIAVTELENLINTPILSVTKQYLREVCNKAILAIGMLESENSELKAKVENLEYEVKYYEKHIPLFEESVWHAFKEREDKLTMENSALQASEASLKNQVADLRAALETAQAWANKPNLTEQEWDYLCGKVFREALAKHDRKDVV